MTAAIQAQPPLGGPAATPPRTLLPNARPVRSCESLTEVSLPNTTIESAKVDGNACRVTAVTTHPPEGDRVTIWVAIPMTGWNGRFLGNGGGGFSGGSAGAVNGGVTQGFASGSTDTGHEGGSGSFALNSNGRLNWQLIRDNGHVGIHEMTVTGKALTEALYGTAPRYSYFNGCSTGGRQGLMEAQRYPEDYDGIASGAPAINWPKLHVQQLWGPMLMNVENNPVAPCKLAAVTEAAIAACDLIDGVQDNLIGDPTRCIYGPSELVGTSMGGTRETDGFIRLFMAPGVGHCGGGGPAPTGLLDAVINWVENGEAPDRLEAAQSQSGGDVIRSRPLCPFPEVARYRGRGDTDEAENFDCSDDF